MGAAALSADQLTTWFAAQAYNDLTSTTITKLANWYLTDGAKEGVRGDVAFAQAVLETGGFSSPDAVGLNNYAGIGHCDTCGQGSGFPSPEAGVLGQLQLLRIFAGGGVAPKPAPPPVLPTLTPAHQGRRGCCPTWESLTGVWASDPDYGIQILTMYEQMLDLATTDQPRPPGT
jgi:N-acetylmuramoyl-L-alanine amidase